MIAVYNSKMIAVYDSKVIAVYDSKVVAVYDSKVLWCRLLVHLARCSRLQTRMLRASLLTHMVQPSQRPLALRGEMRCDFMHHTCLSVRHIVLVVIPSMCDMLPPKQEETSLCLSGVI